MLSKIILAFFLVLTFVEPILSESSNSIKLELISSELDSPIAMSSPAGELNAIYIVEQKGVIKVIRDGVLKKAPFLDIQKKLDSLNNSYSEKGLLGLAFHPDYKNNRKFYVYYSAESMTTGSDHKSIISEFQSTMGNPDKAFNSEKKILEIEQPEANHNGGTLAFGSDGFLYIGTGDGGGAGDMHGDNGNGQNLNSLLGKILRMDVNSDTGFYAIPNDNPKLGNVGKSLIYAYGFRNPWKFSFDKDSNRLFAADVGQNKYEEVNIVEKGGNYGWKIMEGNHCYYPIDNCEMNKLKLPIVEYPHSTGISIIGGHVYRKSKKSIYYGQYIFGDWTGKIFALKEVTKNKWKMNQLTISISKEAPFQYINSFGEDSNGNIYLLGQKGNGPKAQGYVYKLKL
jgi:glucose/arabinose dehydrogenase